MIARAEMTDTLLASPGIESGGSITIMTWANETGLVAGRKCLLNEARPVFSTRVSILHSPRTSHYYGAAIYNARWHIQLFGKSIIIHYNMHRSQKSQPGLVYLEMRLP
jgi:hypothetical protein